MLEARGQYLKTCKTFSIVWKQWGQSSEKVTLRTTKLIILRGKPFLRGKPNKKGYSGLTEDLPTPTPIMVVYPLYNRFSS